MAETTHHIVVSSYSSSLATVAFTEPTASSTGSLSVVSSTEVGFHPSWAVGHPLDKSLVFTGLEEMEGKIVVLKYDAQGKGTIVAESEKGTASCPCHLIIDEEGTELIVANYIPGSVATFSISKDAPYLLSPRPIAKWQPDSSSLGPNKERQQDGPHAHEVVLHNGELLVADLGTDHVWRYHKPSKNAGWTLKGKIIYPAGAGPRHLIVHPQTKSIYTILELTSGLAKHTYPEGEYVTHKSTLRGEVAQDMLAAEILIPSQEPLIYVSNRNDPDPKGDTIGVFSQDSFELVAEHRTGLKHMRGMKFVGKDQKYVVAGGANNNTVKVFGRADGGKAFEEVASVEVEAPTGFLVL